MNRTDLPSTSRAVGFVPPIGRGRLSLVRLIITRMFPFLAKKAQRTQRRNYFPFALLAIFLESLAVFAVKSGLWVMHSLVRKENVGRGSVVRGRFLSPLSRGTRPVVWDAGGWLNQLFYPENTILFFRSGTMFCHSKIKKPAGAR